MAAALGAVFRDVHAYGRQRGQPRLVPKARTDQPTAPFGTDLPTIVPSISQGQQLFVPRGRLNGEEWKDG